MSIHDELFGTRPSLEDELFGTPTANLANELFGQPRKSLAEELFDDDDDDEFDNEDFYEGFGETPAIEVNVSVCNHQEQKHRLTLDEATLSRIKVGTPGEMGEISRNALNRGKDVEIVIFEDGVATGYYRS